MPTARRIQKQSKALRKGFRALLYDVVTKHNVQFLEHALTQEGDMVLVGNWLPVNPVERFQIVGLEGGGFYTRLYVSNPKIDRDEKGHIFYPNSLDPEILKHCGQYHKSFANAFAAVLAWETIPEREIPREPHPPTQST
jgi:hypothetical protein